MDVSAAAWVWPATLGTLMAPRLTTILTTAPSSTCVPAVGDWEITFPAGTVRLCAVVTVPTASRAPVMVVSAAAWV